VLLVLANYERKVYAVEIGTHRTHRTAEEETSGYIDRKTTGQSTKVMSYTLHKLTSFTGSGVTEWYELVDPRGDDVEPRGDAEVDVRGERVPPDVDLGVTTLCAGLLVVALR